MGSPAEAAALRAVPASGLQCVDSRANRRPRAVSLWPVLLIRLGPRVPQVTVITANGTLPEPEASPPREHGISREGGLGDPPRASNPSSGNDVATEDGGPPDNDVSWCCASGRGVFRSAALGQSCSGATEQPSTSPKTQRSVPQAIHLFTNLLSKIFVALETSISENIPFLFLFFCFYFMPHTHLV